MKFHVLTLFPEMIEEGLSHSITGRALKQNIIEMDAINIRDFSQDKRGKVDDYTYGGGAGMLMQAQPVYDAWKSVCDNIRSREKSLYHECNNLHPRTVYVTPQGSTFNQQMAKDFAGEEDLVILCGHYEGIDERVLEEVVTDYVSIGDYVLTGGELPAMVMIDAIARMVPGVLHNDESAETESFHGKLLEYPQYSRPEVWHGRTVPEVLLSGNQKQIDKWRREQSVKRTFSRRPDLYREYMELSSIRDMLMENKLVYIDMIECINRARAEVHYFKEKEVLIFDTEDGDYRYANLGDEDSVFLEQNIENLFIEENAFIYVYDKKSVETLYAHGYKLYDEYNHVVYTKREKLPIRGLYTLSKDRRSANLSDKILPGAVIVKIDEKYAQDAAELYYCNEPEYVKELVKAGNIWGVISDDKLVAMAGCHNDGSMGLLTVDENYRGKGLAKALETFIINKSLEMGLIPYAMVAKDNLASNRLQDSLGLYRAKSPVWIFEKN